MHLRAVAGLSVLPLILFACASAPTNDDESEKTNSALIGGTEATVGEFPSTLVIENNCTAAKVGPRHILLAGHCVYDETDHILSVRPGELIHVSTRINLTTTSKLIPVTIDSVYVPAVFNSEVTPPDEIRILQPTAAPDVAVITLMQAATTGPFGQIPSANVDLNPLPVGAGVIIGGYGCDQGVNVPFDYSHITLKTQATTTLPPSALLHPNSEVTDLNAPWAQNLVQQFFFTPGQSMDPTQASICPGDSGAPVYRNDGTAKNIVGVNAYYSFLPGDEKLVSYTNWHTRFDTGSRFDTGTWLSTLGVQVTGTPSHHYEGCTLDPTTKINTCGAFRGQAATAGSPTAEARRELTNGKWIWQQKFERATLVETASGGVITQK